MRYSEQTPGWKLVTWIVYFVLMNATYLGIRYFFLHILPLSLTQTFGYCAILYAIAYYMHPLWSRLRRFSRDGRRRRSPSG